MASSEMSKASAVVSAQRRVKKSAVLSNVAAVKEARLEPVSVVVTWVGMGLVDVRGVDGWVLGIRVQAVLQSVGHAFM